MDFSDCAGDGSDFFHLADVNAQDGPLLREHIILHLLILHQVVHKFVIYPAGSWTLFGNSLFRFRLTCKTVWTRFWKLQGLSLGLEFHRFTQGLLQIFQFLFRISALGTPDIFERVAELLETLLIEWIVEVFRNGFVLNVRESRLLVLKAFLFRKRTHHIVEFASRERLLGTKMTFFLETELAGVVGLLKLGLVCTRLNLVLFQSKILNDFCARSGMRTFIRMFLFPAVFIIAFEFGRLVFTDHPIGIFEVRLQYLHVEFEFESRTVFGFLQGLCTRIGPICVGFIVVCLVLYVFLQFFRAASRWFVGKRSIFLMHFIFKAALEFVVT